MARYLVEVVKYVSDGGTRSTPPWDLVIVEREIITMREDTYAICTGGATCPE